jgi:predicted nucleic acid-binding protein
LYHHSLFDVLFYRSSSLSRCDLLVIEPIKNGSYIDVMIKFDHSKQYVAY